jgi:hypothetical protein
VAERPKNPRWRSERNPRRQWHEMRAKVLAEGRCRRCHATRSLEAAHIIPRSRVGARKGAESALNCVPLCNPCHRLLDQERGFSLFPFLASEEWEWAVGLVGEGEAERRLKPCAFDCLCPKHERKAA